MSTVVIDSQLRDFIYDGIKSELEITKFASFFWGKFLI